MTGWHVDGEMAPKSLRRIQVNILVALRSPRKVLRAVDFCLVLMAADRGELFDNVKLTAPVHASLQSTVL